MSSSIKNTKSPILEEKIKSELMDIYDNLNEKQKGIVDNLPSDMKNAFLYFLKQKKEQKKSSQSSEELPFPPELVVVYKGLSKSKQKIIDDLSTAKEKINLLTWIKNNPDKPVLSPHSPDVLHINKNIAKYPENATPFPPDLIKVYKGLSASKKKIVDELTIHKEKIKLLNFIKANPTKELISPHSPDVLTQEEEWNGEWGEYIPMPILDFGEYFPPEHIEKGNYRSPLNSSEIDIEKDIDEIIEEEEEKINKSKTPLQIKFQNIIKSFYSSNPYFKKLYNNSELEVRFGTRGVKPLTKNDYDNVIKKIKSLGFSSSDENGVYSLRIQNERLDNVTGRFSVSNIRAEIDGFNNIQQYCKNNNINNMIKQYAVTFTKKTLVMDDKRELIFPVNFDDFNFKVSYQNEEQLQKKGAVYYLINSWDKTKKTFRYFNRVSFKHPDFPVIVDISIVKMSEKNKTFYTTDESKVFTSPEIYEIELEIDNSKIGPGTRFNNYNIVLESLRKVIKFVLSGLQGTNFPISYPEQKEVIASYMKILHKENYDPKKWIYSSDFIGYNPITLQISNIIPINENSNVPNIRKEYTVTDKADGDRHLLYISDIGKIYLINTNMNVIFTGAITLNKETFNSLIDGELILHDKNGKFINLFASFDIYYLNKEDVRALSFILPDKEKDLSKSRHYLLKKLITTLNPISIENNKIPESESTNKSLLSKFLSNPEFISPIRIECKSFYPENPKTGNIFAGCNDILTKADNDLFEYTIDGLIFTPAFMGVGADQIGKSGPITRTTWEYSFKWKPPKYNTVDFLVTTVKSINGDDIVKPIFEEGTNVMLNTQLNEYKIIQLRCSFIEGERGHGFINPCQDLIDDNFPEHNSEDKKGKRKKAQPVQFYPTKPYDPEAGICNIMLRNDENNVKQMFSEENEVFEDNTIVEFRYKLDAEKGWRWIPLRVRYDKTSELRQGQPNYGNAYTTANSNWQSIHNPITDDMIRTGLNIPELLVDEDVYYNKSSDKFKTNSLKDFHNLYVKKLLIKSVSKNGNTLIDFACGKGGDLPKWIDAKLSFVFGIDVSKDNLENRLDGACARFLSLKIQNKNMPYALFVNGNSAYNIKNGAAMLNDKAIQITKAVFGVGSKDPEQIGKGVARQYGKGQEGFNISSCQFALHYFFENPDTLQGFLRNVSECTKLDGYFIGTAFDGNTIFNLLKKKQTGESVQIVEDGKKVFEIIKMYNSNIFDDNSSSLGYKIDVYQESINQVISEYLINFDYLNRVFEDYGFKLVDRVEAQTLGLPQGTGLFSELFLNMLDEIKLNKYKAKDYKDAPNMTAFEKKISFLNRYFVYKKIRHVNTEKIEIELGEYNQGDNQINYMETQQAVKTGKTEVKKLTETKVNKVRKLNKKLLLVPGTEAIDQEASPTPQQQVIENIELNIDLLTEAEPTSKAKKIKNAASKPKTVKKKLIIIED